MNHEWPTAIILASPLVPDTCQGVLTGDSASAVCAFGSLDVGKPVPTMLAVVQIPMQSPV